MKTRCKFICQTITRNAGYDADVIGFIAVSGDTKGEENFSKFTPSGNLTITVTNPNIIGKFELGKKYFVDISSTEE